MPVYIGEDKIEDFYIGEEHLSKIYIGEDLAWESEADLGSFVLDVSRFDASNPVLYSTSGKAIGTMDVKNGDLAEQVYVTDDDCLHCGGYAAGRIPVELTNTEPWTIVYKFKNFTVPSGYYANAWIMNASNGNFETLMQYLAPTGVTFRVGASDSGRQLYNFTTINSSLNAALDQGVPPQDMYRYLSFEYRWVFNGTNVSVFRNGIKKAQAPITSFSNQKGTVISAIDIVNVGNAYYADNALDLMDCRVIKGQALGVSHTLYRWHITGFKSTDDHFQFSKLCLYAGNTRIDQEDDCHAELWVNGDPPDYATASLRQEYPFQLLKNGSAKVCARRGQSFSYADLYFCVPVNLPAVTSYSYVTSNDIPGRDPISWTLYKSADGGVTWTELDTQTNASITDSRSTETQRFYTVPLLLGDL